MYNGRRFIGEFTHVVDGSPEEVFPLLCPVRESDWIPGWSAEIVYSSSGIAENNCVFRSGFNGRCEAVYIVTRYEPDRFVIEFAIFHPGLMVEKLDLSLSRGHFEETRTTLHWRRTYTGLCREGDAIAEQSAGESFPERMTFIAASLNDYLRKSRQSHVL